MKTKPQFKSKGNNSTQTFSPRLLQTLKDVQIMDGGIVNYYFVQERTIFSKEFPKGKLVKLKSTTAAPINSAMFCKEVKGKLLKRTSQEILQVFEDTKDDLGADYFVIS